MGAMSVRTRATTMQPTGDQARFGHVPGRLPELPPLIDGGGAAAVLRRRAAVPVGALGAGGVSAGRRLVRATDVHDVQWWIPADVVWADAEETMRPEHPWSVGLATDRSWSRAVLAGLSDRLAWEARLAHERGEHLAVARGIAAPGDATVLDGRFGHDVPTVHIVGEHVVRGGAGVTMDAAYRRALFGDHGLAEGQIARELADIQLVLSDAGLHVAVVDVGTELLRAAGVARVSVQLMGR